MNNYSNNYSVTTEKNKWEINLKSYQEIIKDDTFNESDEYIVDNKII